MVLLNDPKFIGSNAPPSKPKPRRPEPTWNPAGTASKVKSFRAFDPTGIVEAKPHEPVWHPPSVNRPPKPPKYFEPTMKPELVVPIRKETTTVLNKKPRVQSADPKLKTRIAKAESKVKSAWEQPTATTIVQKPKPPIAPGVVQKPKVKPAPVKKFVRPAPVPIDTGRSSLKDVPTKPMFESTPRDQSLVDEDPDDLF